MKSVRPPRLALVLGSAALLLATAPAGASEHWGRVKSVDPRFNTFVVEQDGTHKLYTFRIGPDTDFVLLNKQVVWGLDVRELLGKRVYCLVEENPSHFVMKLWIRKDVPPERDPINPGVGATRLP